jgi:hypothetical protein
VVDGVSKLVMISGVVGGDRLPCSVSYCILASGPEGWSLVSAEHIGSADDLHDCLVLFLARAWNSLDSELWRSGDVDAVQQIPQYASGDRGFISKSFDLIGIVEHLILLGVTPRSVVFIFFALALLPSSSSSSLFLPPAGHGHHSAAYVELLACLPLLVL